jgi:ParB family transcriptional regulator, chromosome partitioning protein
VSRRSGLGRGLGSLIPQVGPQPASSGLIQIPLDQISSNPNQPRKQFDEEALASLVDSIKVMGVLQPVLVREVGPGDYQLIAGERRYRAARRAGMATIPAVVRMADDISSIEQALVENLQREDLNPLDEAGAYQQLIEDFDLTHDEVARRVGKSRTTVTNSLRLFQLPPVVQRQIRDNLLSAGHARAILGTPDRSLQERLALDVVLRGLSVRAVEELVREASKAESSEPDATLNGENPGNIDAAVASNTKPAIDDAALPAREPGRRLRPPGLLDLEEMLGDYLNTRVSVDMGSRHGRVLIEFANLDDLERIYRIIIGGTVPPG